MPTSWIPLLLINDTNMEITLTSLESDVFSDLIGFVRSPVLIPLPSPTKHGQVSILEVQDVPAVSTNVNGAD
jgi:hypothetical protein